MTPSEALEKAKAFKAAGWDVFPMDDPERGLQGYCAFRIVEGVEESEQIEYPVVEGAPLTVDKAYVTPEELADFIKSGADQRCDDALALRLGFVRYDLENRVSMVRQTGVSSLKRASTDLRNLISDFRTTLSEEISSQFEARRLALYS